MLSRRLRLGRAAFPSRNQGYRASSPSFSIVYGPSSRGGCAVVVSKTVAKKATARNLMKRRILSLTKPWCSSNRFVVVYAKGTAAVLPFPKLKDELTSLLTGALR